LIAVVDAARIFSKTDVRIFNILLGVVVRDGGLKA